MSVNDRDLVLNDFDDLIDHFVIPINISAGSSITRNYTGKYNYVQLELTIEVMCVGNDTDDNCVFDWCRFNSINCNNGSCVNEVEGPRCECNSAFINGDYCTEIDDCMVSNDCQNGDCVDEDGGYRCECHPGFSGRFCEDNIDDCIGVTCSGAVVCSLIILSMFACLALLVLPRRTKSINIQGKARSSLHTINCITS